MIKKIDKPTLIINKKVIVNNLKKLIKLSENNNVYIRPHFKTHQSLQIGQWFKDLGVDKITVSSVTMAEYFSNEWDDITIAFPLNILELYKINMLLKKTSINLLIDSEESVDYLTNNLDHIANVYIKIDVGYNRAGINYKETYKIKKIIEKVNKSNKLNFYGFLSHFGNTYKSKDKNDIARVFDNSIKNLKILSSKLDKNINISIGDTPSCSTVNNFPDLISEIRPGNFIFYDLAQYKIGSCRLEEIGIRMICPIVSVYKERNKLLIYGGSVHFSKDFFIDKGNQCYGYVYHNDDYWDVNERIGYIKSLSQEHGIIEIEKKGNYKIGDLLSIIPVHSCLTADKMREYYCDGNKITMMKI